jgi:hypothetical protein
MKNVTRAKLIGQPLGHKASTAKNRCDYLILDAYLAEREGFEPPIRLPVCRISSAVHSTTLPPLRKGKSLSDAARYVTAARC